MAFRNSSITGPAEHTGPNGICSNLFAENSFSNYCFIEIILHMIFLPQILHCIAIGLPLFWILIVLKLLVTTKAEKKLIKALGIVSTLHANKLPRFFHYAFLSRHNFITFLTRKSHLGCINLKSQTLTLYHEGVAVPTNFIIVPSYLQKRATPLIILSEGQLGAESLLVFSIQRSHTI